MFKAHLEIPDEFAHSSLRPTGRAWLPEAGSCQGRKRLWNSRLWKKHWPHGRVFSAGAFQANSALVPYSLLHREMGEGKPLPPTGSLSPGDQDKKLEEGGELRKDVGSVPPAPPLRKTVRWMDGGGRGHLRCLELQGVARDSRGAQAGCPCHLRGDGVASSKLDQVAGDLDGRAVLGWGWGPPGDLCSQHEEGWVWRKERRVGRQEKCLRSRNNGLFSAAPPGLRDRPVGWRPALPCPDHLQHGLLQPSPALGAAHGPAWVGQGAPSSPPQLRTHSWIHGSIYFLLTEAGPLWWMRGLYKHDLCVMDAEMEEESPSHWPVAPACCL